MKLVEGLVRLTRVSVLAGSSVRGVVWGWCEIRISFVNQQSFLKINVSVEVTFVQCMFVYRV